MATYTVRVVSAGGTPIQGARIVAVGERLDELTDAAGEIAFTIGSYAGALGVHLVIEGPGGSPIVGAGPVVLEPGVAREIAI
tara:strand:+ start:443 stop:688 length:246 start_codon:yes stop_codon:yes gene_type:complete